MPSAGDYVYYQRIYSKKNISVDYAGSALDNAIAPKNANYQLYIQKITLSATTAAAVTVTFDDDGAGNPIAAKLFTTTPETVVFDFGPEGVAITKGANLDVSAGAGITGKLHIEAYERLVGPVAMGVNN